MIAEIALIPKLALSNQIALICLLVNICLGAKVPETSSGELGDLDCLSLQVS